MAPLLIGSSNLLIDEMVRRRRVGDFRLPMKGHAEQLELVIDQRAALHPNRQRGKYLKLKCGRGDLFEITRIRKKRKRVAEVSRNQLRLLLLVRLCHF